MAKNTSITLGDHFENFINQKIGSGKYNSVSEVIRSALRLLEKEENKVDLIVSELEAGENSKLVEDFNPNEFLKTLKKKHL